MAGALGSDQTTFLSNLVVEVLGPASGAGGVSATSTGQIQTSRLSSRLTHVANEVWASGVSGSRTTSPFVSLVGSTSTLNVNQGRLMSVRTLAASALTASAANTNIRADELVLVIGGASGASLAIHSGGTVYIFNSAASAAVV